MEIVFDTNAYRSLTYGKSIEQVRKEFGAITGTEERKGFRVFMSPVPWMELCSHLADPDDPAFNLCLTAMVGSFIHTRRHFASTEGKLMPQWQLLLAHILFQFRNEEAVRSIFALDDLAKAIEASPSLETVEANRPNFKDIRAFSDKMKAQFVAMFQQRQQEFHGFAKTKRAALRREFNRDEMLISLLTTLLVGSAHWASIDLSQLSDDAWIQKLILIGTHFPTPCYLLRNIAAQMIGDPDFKIESKNRKRKNWYWDFQMLFYISNQNALLLVTDDQDMIDAAADAGLASRVIKLEEYIGILQLNIKIVGGRGKSSPNQSV